MSNSALLSTLIVSILDFAFPNKKHFHSPQATQLSYLRYILPQPSHLEDDGYPKNFNIVPSVKQAETDGKNVLVDKRGKMCAFISLVFVQKLSKQKSEIRPKIRPEEVNNEIWTNMTLSPENLH